jgi:hypothetical protein
MVDWSLRPTFDITSYTPESRARIYKHRKMDYYYPNCTICYNENVGG